MGVLVSIITKAVPLEGIGLQLFNDCDCRIHYPWCTHIYYGYMENVRRLKIKKKRKEERRTYPKIIIIKFVVLFLKSFQGHTSSPQILFLFFFLRAAET
jgi:hypothetical protein